MKSYLEDGPALIHGVGLKYGAGSGWLLPQHLWHEGTSYTQVVSVAHRVCSWVRLMITFLSSSVYSTLQYYEY